MADDYSARAKLIIQQLKALRREGKITAEEMKNFSRIIETLGGGTGQFLPAGQKTVTVINQLAGALRRVGFQDQYINRVKRSLLELARVSDRYATISQRLSSLPAGASIAEKLAATRGPREQLPYLIKAAQTVTPAQAEKLEANAVRDLIGARATQLKIADELQKKITQQYVAERQLTDEKKRQEAVYKQTLADARAMVVAAQRRQAETALRGASGAVRGIIDNAQRDIEATRRLLAESKQYRMGPQLTAYTERIRQQQPRGRQLPTIGPEELDIRQIVEQYRTFIPGGVVGIENLTKRMEGLGIKTATVTNATEELSTGVRTLRFRIDRGNGAIATATVHMDKFGNVMRETSNRYRTFSSAVSNNLVKVIAWGVATGLVYGTIRRLSSTMKEMIDIQNQLASIQVSLGKSTGDLNAIFEESARIADLTGSSISGVVESYSLAFQAAGSYEDIATRTAQANSLLEESMILAKLGTIDQAKAIDILTGALRQTGRELNEGRDLLDKWVRVSRESNVSLGTLAETYSIVGAQAQDLGLTFEQLNALAATLAEATNLSATETGNAIRGILAGFQTETAEKTLGRFGIETRTATGELKDFWDLLQEIGKYIAAGALTPSQISEISNAIGGGYKRGGQVQIILRGLARSQQLVTDQFDASGDAADALDIRLSTLQSSITILGNAFTKLSKTLGSEGGILGTAKLLVDTLTVLVNIIDRLVAGLGKGTPAILAFGAALLTLQSEKFAGFFGKEAGGLLGGIAGKFGAYTPGIFPATGEYARAPFVQQPGTAAISRGAALGGIRGGLQRKLFGIDPLAALFAASAVIPSGVQAIKAPAEQKPEAFTKAGAQLVGAIVGGLIGSATGIGAPIGVIAGQTMAGAFADAVIDRDRDIAGRLAEIFAARAQEELDRNKNAGKPQTPLAYQVPAIERFAADIEAFIDRTFAPKKTAERFGLPEGFKVSSEDVIRSYIEAFGSDEAKKQLEEITAEAIKAGIEEGDIPTALDAAIQSAIPGVQRQAEGVVQAFTEEMRQQFVRGEIDVSQLLNIQKAYTAPKIADNIASLEKALQLAGRKSGLKDLIDDYLRYDDASKQLIDDLTKAALTQAKLKNYAEEQLRLDGASAESKNALREATEGYNTALSNLTSTYDILQKRQQLQQFRERPVVNLGILSDQQINQVLQRAQVLRDRFAEVMSDGNEETAQLYVESLGSVLLTRGQDLGRDFWKEFFNMDPQFVNQAIQDLGLQDALENATSNFQFRDLRDQLGLKDLPALLNRYQKVVGTFQNVFPQYDIQESPIGLILKDGFHTLDADSQLLNLAMQDLIDVNEQQLEGVWNIPSGMTAFVAWTSLSSRNVGGGGTGGGAFDQLFTRDRTQEKPSIGAEKGATGGQGFLVGLQDVLSELDRKIAGLEPFVNKRGVEREVGTEQYLSLKAELESLQNKRATIAETIRLYSGALGVTGIQPVEGGQGLDSNAIVEGIKDALTVQSKIELNANIRLIVDGRTLANVIKKYLFTDLEGASNRSGTSGGYVIEGE